MSRIQKQLAALHSAGRKALIPYIMAGYPQPAATVPLMHAMVAAGADIIELGMPFSDPMADGPVIQQAAEAALAQGVGLAQVLAMVAEFRRQDTQTPVVLMGYANPVEAYNLHHGPPAEQANPGQHSDVGSAFVQHAAKAGVDGVLIVDYPPEECTDFKSDLDHAGMDLIFLLAPTSTDARMAEIGHMASGYVYYVSLTGVTGSASLNTAAVAQTLPKIRKHINIPVGVGFGIRDAASAQAVAAVADAVVIGSKIIQLLQPPPNAATTEAAEQNRGRAAVSAFLREVRMALDSPN